MDSAKGKMDQNQAGLPPAGNLSRMTHSPPATLCPGLRGIIQMQPPSVLPPCPHQHQNWQRQGIGTLGWQWRQLDWGPQDWARLGHLHQSEDEGAAGRCVGLATK